MPVTVTLCFPKLQALSSWEPGHRGREAGWGVERLEFQKQPGDAPGSNGGPGGCGAARRGLSFSLPSSKPALWEPSSDLLWWAWPGGSSSGVGPICGLQGVQKFLPLAGRGEGLLSGICQAWPQHLVPKSFCLAAVCSATFPATQTLKK